MISRANYSLLKSALVLVGNARFKLRFSTSVSLPFWFGPINLLSQNVNCYSFVRHIGTTFWEKPRNEQIKEKTVFVVNSNGQAQGEMPLVEALQLAVDGLLLVQINEKTNTRPAVCKLISKKTLKEMRVREVKQKKIKHKELELTGRIADADLVWKSKKVRNWLKDGHFVSVFITHTSKKQATIDDKMEIVSKIQKDVESVGILDGEPKNLGDFKLKCKFKSIPTSKNISKGIDASGHTVS